MGDILFAAANLARKLDIDPEAALRRATAKFERRFRAVEALAAERGIGADLEALEALWQEVKRGEEYESLTSKILQERSDEAIREGSRRRRLDALHAREICLNAAVAGGASGRCRLREPHREMGDLVVVAAAEHLAVAVDPGERLAVAQRDVEPHRAGRGSSRRSISSSSASHPSPVAADNATLCDCARPGWRGWRAPKCRADRSCS